jgi:hypothetical protein
VQFREFVIWNRGGKEEERFREIEFLLRSVRVRARI